MEGFEQDMWRNLASVLKSLLWRCVEKRRQGVKVKQEAIAALQVRDVVVQTWMAGVEVLKCGQSVAIFWLCVTEVAKLSLQVFAAISLPINKGDFLCPHTLTNATQ